MVALPNLGDIPIGTHEGRSVQVGDAVSTAETLLQGATSGQINPEAAGGLGASVKAFVSSALTADSPLPHTRTRTSHALTIHGIGPGRRGIIGAVHVLNINQSRDTEDIFEVQSLGQGRPVDVVPGNLVGRTMTIARYDLFSRTMEQVFGKRKHELIDLTDQSHPFTLRTTWGFPGLAGGFRKSIFEYTGCWFQNLGRNISATDDRIVNVDATLVWTRRYRVAGR